MANLATLLNEHVNGATFISINTETAVKLKGGRKNLQQGRVTKRVTGSNVMVFQNKNTNAYENMVMRRLEKEGKNPQSFQLGPRTWGTRIPNTPFIEHKGNHYVEVIFLSAGDVEYQLDGIVVDSSQIEGLPDRKPEGQQGGLEDKVIIRTYSVESIKSITIDKQTYNNLTFSL